MSHEDTLRPSLAADLDALVDPVTEVHISRAVPGGSGLVVHVHAEQVLVVAIIACGVMLVCAGSALHVMSAALPVANIAATEVACPRQPDHKSGCGVGFPTAALAAALKNGDRRRTVTLPSASVALLASAT